MKKLFLLAVGVAFAAPALGQEMMIWGLGRHRVPSI
jgi:hypothetical protein